MRPSRSNPARSNPARSNPARRPLAVAVTSLVATAAAAVGLSACAPSEVGEPEAAATVSVDPTATSTTEVAGVTVTQWGAGRDVVLLAGGEDAEAWAPLATSLAADGRLVVALPAAGADALADVAQALAEDTDAGTVTLAGAGRQATAVLALGAAQPDLVDAVAALSPTEAVEGAGALPTTIVVADGSESAEVADAIGMAGAASGQVQVYSVAGRRSGLDLLAGAGSGAVITYVTDRLAGVADDPLSQAPTPTDDAPVDA
ncbi:hypothetical protein [Nocardioides sp. GY 10127]|uniref:hypothetical protein n=1 Tax=Nocardioides sp. GY 10127 TaxID=2569762 RepID=UPI0010A81829|nr:hypothetical protein [Nocardioides sp. GY 10127]TIC81802.1 hypothetical protein E8D37_11525 [Nocardioides sp. GY 10127]